MDIKIDPWPKFWFTSIFNHAFVYNLWLGTFLTNDKKLIIFRLNSEKPIVPADIFHAWNRLLDSVSDVESHDEIILTGFPEKQISEILIKIYNCVGSTNTRRWFLMKECLTVIREYPVIFRCLLGVYDFDKIWTPES